jgi:surfeit locus 1 family protein
MNRRLRSLIAPAVATLVVAAFLVGLGEWQLQRLSWKEGLIAAVASRTHAAPVDMPVEAQWPALDPADYEYRHVKVAGVYDASQQALVFRALGEPHGPYGGPGYFVITPLRLADGSAVLVNRGFVPQDRVDAAALSAPGQQETVVTGLMRASEARNWFTPADNPASGHWFTRDVQAIGRAMGLARFAPFSIDADAGADPNALPESGETIVEFPNNHFSYAMTWFGLAAGLLCVFVSYAASQLRAAEDQESDAAAPDDRDRVGPA